MDHSPGRMTLRAEFDKIELHLVRVLHTLLTERSVSRAALRLQSSQPAVSAQLKRLRELTGDPLLVRAGNGMTPTATGQSLLGPAANLLAEADRLFSPRARRDVFDPQTSAATFRIAASDFIDPGFLPGLVLHLKALAPRVRIELQPLSSHFDYRRSLAQGEVDLVIGNWLAPPGELHLGRLLSDEVVCLVSEDHPVARAGGGRAWTVEKYLACEHVAPMPNYQGARGVIDDHLRKLGLLRECLSKEAFADLAQLAKAIKALPLRLTRTRPIDEAISTAGGVAFEALDAKLMIERLPGVFCAGEMLDWEAPTGGYLLTACFASGAAAGQGALDYLAKMAR